MSQVQKTQLTANQFNSIIIETPEFKGSSLVYKATSLVNKESRFSIHFDKDYSLHFYTLDMPLFISYKIQPADIRWEFSIFEDEQTYHIKLKFGYASLDLSFEDACAFLQSLKELKGYDPNNDEAFTNDQIKQSLAFLDALIEKLTNDFNAFLNRNDAYIA